MVVLPGVPGLKAHVKVNGVRTEEYVNEEEEDTGNTGVRYIEAISGATFSVHWKFSRTFKHKNRDIHGSVYVDGKYAGSNIATAEQLRSPSGYNWKVRHTRSYEGGQHVIREMLFSAIDIGMAFH